MLSSPRRWLFIASPLLTILFVYSYLLPHTDPVVVSTGQWTQSEANQSPIIVDGTQSGPEIDTPGDAGDAGSLESRCGNIPRDMQDIMVIVKTGATEARDKLPVQLRTGLQCVPHFAVFSDYEETINGVRTYDVLRNVTDATREKEPEFQFYRRLQQLGREGLTEQDLGDDSNSPFGKVNNPGWKLDKWKFIPMIDGALTIKPDAKWYYFIEVDTYVVWPNLADWLHRFDPTRPFYLGSPMQIGETVFGHGGGGILLSNPALTRLHELRAQSPENLEALTAQEWAGDCVLARALDQIQIPLTWTWPMMLVQRPWEIDHFSEGYGRQPWCYPVVSYHHMSPRDIEEMWRFDREWFRSGKNALLLHADVYREFIHERGLAVREDWDNLSGAEIVFDPPSTPSLESCADACAQNNECLQYTWTPGEKSCKQASSSFAGVARNGTHSGWHLYRVERLLTSFQSSCPQVEFILG
ncbi:hypothetical protein N7492_007881 [Penicillium capsulatum]|uniref:N-acetylgalactosaminide beta-1,3-galactosyltransferase n=1 Tax=Penicillium capsulatum TaxID=69766 RepID=A0A9W9I222_9EURO|nr:hypothetical protein N7492_007881 [Penicillium capsulatum]KAJ6117712.1 hypothetical protein N7512_007437 [Penicillium capsulatum]